MDWQFLYMSLAVKIVLAVFVSYSVCFDLYRDRIPNQLTRMMMFEGLFVQVAEYGTDGFTLYLKGVGALFLVTGLLYLLKAMRGGDCKFLIAAGGLLGPKGGIWLLTLSMLIGALIGIHILAADIHRTGRGRHYLHFGLPIYLGYLAMLLMGEYVM